MNASKYTLISSLLLLLIVTLLTLVPNYILSIMLLSAFICYSGYFVNHNYDIDYKYWFSFISQLGGLLLIVASFVLMMDLIFNLLGQH